MEDIIKQLKNDRRGISNVIIIMLSLVLIVIIVANVVLWSYQMNQFDWERMQEDLDIVDVACIEDVWSYNPSGYALGGSTNLLSGNVSNLTSDDGVYMAFRSYYSGTDITDLVDETCDLYFPLPEGTHSNFTAQQHGPDSVYDILTEGVEEIIYENSAESYSTIGQSSHSFVYSLQKDSGYDRLVVVMVSWEDAEASASISSLTFNGTAMTHIINVTVSTGYSEYISLWYLLDSSLPSNPGSYNIAVTVSESITREIYMAVVEYSGVKQSAPDDSDTNANTSAGNTSITLTAVTDGSVVVAGVGEGGTNALTDTNNIDNLQDQVLTSSGSALGHRTNVDSGNITVGWNNLATREGMAGAVWQSTSNHELDLEVQWTNVDYDEPNEEVCVYAEITGSEDIRVDVWYDDSWTNLFSDLSSGWNNISVSSYLVSSTLTIRFKDGICINDTVSDSWNIDATLLHVWTEPDEYTAEVDITGSSNLEGLSQLKWIVDSAWTAGSVSVELQLYNHTLNDYSTGGNGYISYTSDDVPNIDENKNQTISVNSAHFINATGHWKMKIKGVKATGTSFDLKIDFFKFEVTKAYGASFTFRNEGPLTLHLVSLWINNSTHHQRYDTDIFINSGDTESYNRIDINLPSEPYIVKFITERGNIVIFTSY